MNPCCTENVLSACAELERENERLRSELAQRPEPDVVSDVVLAARLASAKADLAWALDFIARQGGYLKGDDRVSLRGVKARQAER